MSTPEETPQLTRRQLRELRNTAATPIITETQERATEQPPAPSPRAAEPDASPEPVAPPETPAEPAAPPTTADDGSRPLTRREIRQRERLRTASVPVITSEILAVTAAEREKHAAERAAAEVPADDWSDPSASSATSVEEQSPDRASEVVQAETVDEAPAQPIESESSLAAVEELVVTEVHADEGAAGGGPSAAVEAERTDAAASAADSEAGGAEPAPSADAEEDEKRVVASAFGADLLQGTSGEPEVPASFDQLLTRGSAATGAISMPNALILSQTPEGGSLTAPVTATGEILITGTFALPDHYGSTGTVPGHADGKEADAVLVDGELPAASSPTPIAASAAISTIKSADEIIKPPAPERGSRLMVVLAITAGVLAVALAGVLILAITTGIF